MNYSIRPLDHHAIQEVYASYLQYDFPENERRPLFNIYDLIEKGIYDGIGYYQDDTLIGYAFLFTQPYLDLIDYFAIIPSCRHQHLGTQFLKALIQRGKPFFLESEDPEDDYSLTKEKRIHFYQNAGLKLIPTCIYLYYVNYRLLSTKPLTSNDIEAYYHAIYPEAMLQRHFKITKRDQ